MGILRDEWGALGDWWDDIQNWLSAFANLVTKISNQAWLLYGICFTAFMAYWKIGGELLVQIVRILDSLGSATSASGVSGINYASHSWLNQAFANINYILPLEEAFTCFLAFMFWMTTIFAVRCLNWLFEKIRG